MRVGRVLQSTLLLAGLAGAVLALPGAVQASTKPGGLPLLDLKLRSSDIRVEPEQQPAPGEPGYTAIVREDPWSVLADKRNPLAGPNIPQESPEDRQHWSPNDEITLKKLLDGTTFPILTIDVTPGF